MYQVACTFTSKAASETPYHSLQEHLRNSDSDASVFRVLLNDIWSIAIVGTKVSPAMQRAIDKYLPLKDRIQLPTDALQQLLGRREMRTKEAKPIRDKQGYSFTETHEPTRVALDGSPLPLTPDDLIKLGKEPLTDVQATRLFEDMKNQGRIHEVKNTKEALSTFDAIVADTPNGKPSPITPGTKLNIHTIPFIKAYQDIQASDTIRGYSNMSTGLSAHDLQEGTKHVSLINQVNGMLVKSASKYRFTLSAMNMHKAVFTSNNNTWIEPDNNTWIELDQAITTPYGENIRAIYLCYSYPQNTINRVMPVSVDKQLNSILHQIYSTHDGYYGLAIIDMRCKLVFDLTYDLASKEWIYLTSHICPYNACTYPTTADFEVKGLGRCTPCEKCKAACLYWSSWLRTALLMIQGMYATSPNPEQFQIEPLTYISEERVTVGKGKNKRKVTQTVTRHIDYRVVTYDVSVAKPLLPEHAIELEQTGEKRLNWLQVAEKSSIIWEKRKLPAYKRRYPTKRDGTRQAGTVQVTTFYKWVPYLKPEIRTIKKVVASKYE